MAVVPVWQDPITGKTGYTALSSDTLPNCVDGSVAFITDAPGRVDTRMGGAWVQTHSAGAAHVSDAIIISGFSQATVALSTTAAQSAALDAGEYDVWSDVDCYIKVAATANDVTTSTGYMLRANNTVPVIVPSQEKLGGIVASGTGTLTYHRVK